MTVAVADRQLIEQLQDELNRLTQVIGDLQQQLRDRDRTIREAKDISPVSRPSFKRVKALAESACLNLQKIDEPPIGKWWRGKWLLSLGSRKRRFRSLKEIWEILIKESWNLSELLPPTLKSNRPKPKLRVYIDIRDVLNGFLPDIYSCSVNNDDFW